MTRQERLALCSLKGMLLAQLASAQIELKVATEGNQEEAPDYIVGFNNGMEQGANKAIERVRRALAVVDDILEGVFDDLAKSQAIIGRSQHGR